MRLSLDKAGLCCYVEALEFEGDLVQPGTRAHFTLDVPAGKGTLIVCMHSKGLAIPILELRYTG